MKIRIVNLDFYMSNSIPNLDILYSEFRGSSVNHVPVIRIYGSTEEGEKICLHIHRVFPYIYIPYDGQIAVDGFLYQVASALDKAINLSLGQASSNVQHVYKVCLVTGIPIYGYHTGSHQFLKLYFYNPLIIKKACTLLQNGSILGKIYQPHEAHIPYILQFMIDYNLHGMSFIRLADLKYRSDEYSREKYPENSILPPSIRKMSVCKLEADTTADSILNREEINPGQLTANPGIRALWEDEEQRRRNNGESSQIEHCLTQNRLDVPQTATHMAYKKLLDDRLRTKPKNSDVSPQLELSVYPAETPPSSDVLDASVIENHALSSQNTDDSSVLDETITENFDSDLNDFTLDEDAQKLFDLLRDLKEDNVEKDSILSQVQKEQDSDEEDQDLSIPLNATQTPRKLDETSQKNLDDFLNDSYFESLAKIPQLDGACDHLSMEKEQKLKRGRKKRDIEKKTSEAFQPTIPKAKKLDGKNSIKKNKLENNLAQDTFQNSSCKSTLKDIKKKTKYETIYLGTISGKKRRGRKMTFKVKTSAILYKSKSKYLKISKIITSPTKNEPKNEKQDNNHKEIGSDIEKVIEGICQDINERTKNKGGETEISNREVLKIEDTHGKFTKNLNPGLQDSTLHGAKVSNKVENADVQEIAKLIDRNSVEPNGKSKTRNKRKSIPTKRLIEETSQKHSSNSRRSKNRNLNGKNKNSLTESYSNCKACENQDKSARKSKTNRKTPKNAKEATIMPKNELTFKENNTTIVEITPKKQESNNHKEIDSDIEEIIKGICQDVNKEITPTVDAKNKGDQIEASNGEALKIEDKREESTKTLNSELRDSTVDGAKDSNRIENAEYVQEIVKPIDHNCIESNGKSKTRNRRKSTPTNRLLEKAPQNCPSSFTRSRKSSLKGKTNDFSTGSSNSRICENQNKSVKKTKTNKRTPKNTNQTGMLSKNELTLKGNNLTVQDTILQKPETLKAVTTIKENISKTEENNPEEIDSDIEEVIKNICQNFHEEETPSDKILEISQNRSKATKIEKDVEELKEEINLKESANNSRLSKEDMKIKSLKDEADIAVAQIVKISQNLQNLQKSKGLIRDKLEESIKMVNSELQNSTLDSVNVLDQIRKAGDIQELASKSINQNSDEFNKKLKTKNKRKSIRIKRLLEEAPQKRASSSRKLRNCNLISLRESSSICKIYQDQDTPVMESKTSRKTSKITQQKAVMLKKTSTGNVSNPPLEKCEVLKKNAEEMQTSILQKTETIDSVTVSSSKEQVNNGEENINQNIIVADDLKELPDMSVVPTKKEKVKKKRGRRTKNIPKVGRVVNLPEEQIEQFQEDMESPICSNNIQDIGESSKTVEIVNSPMENLHIQEDTGGTNKTSVINDVQFTKQKANENFPEKVQITNLPKENQLQEEIENLVEMSIIKDDKQRSLNIVDLPIIGLRNNTSEMSEHTLDMPLLFDSFPNEYNQNLDFNVQDDNNNTQFNSFQPCFSIGELPQTIRDAVKNDSYKPLKKRKYSLESILTSQIELQDRKFEENQITQLINEDQDLGRDVMPSKVSRNHSDDYDKYNLRSGGVVKSTDGDDKLKLVKGKKLKLLLKNKRTQTENIFKIPRRPRGRPLIKPVLNFVLTQTQKKDVYEVTTYAVNKKYVRMYDLGPNPRPKFKILPANQPYTFEAKKNDYGKYPNTTWIKCVESGRVALDSCGTTAIQSEKAVMISNRLLEGDQRFQHLEIKKGQVVEVMKSKKLKELHDREAINIELQNSETLSSGEGRNVDTFVHLYDDIKPHLFENNASPRSFSSNSSGRFSLSKVFRSIADVEIDPKKESEDNMSLETQNVDNSTSCSLTDIFQSVTDGPSSDQVDGVNISRSLSNYRQDMNKSYDDLMEKLGKSFDNLFTSITSITEGSSISSRLMLENLNRQTRQDESIVLTKRPFEGIQKNASSDIAKVKSYASINKNLKNKRKTSTLVESCKQIKVKCFEKSDHTFTLKVELAEKPQGQDDGTKTPKNSGKSLEKMPASQKTISTAKNSMSLRRTHACLPTKKLDDYGFNAPHAVQVFEAPILEFNNNENHITANQKLPSMSRTNNLAPSTTLKTSFPCNFESKKNEPSRNSNQSKGKTLESEKSSNILLKNGHAASKRDQYQPRSLHNYGLRSSSIKTYESRFFTIQNNPSEDSNLLRSTPNPSVQLKYQTRPVINRANTNKLTPTSEASHCVKFECKKGLSQRNSKEIMEKTRRSQINHNSFVKNEKLKFKEDIETSKITPKHKEFVGNHRSPEISKRSISIVKNTASCNLESKCEAKVLLKRSSIVDPYVLLKQEAYDDINQYNRGKNLEMKEDTSSVITQASRPGKNKLRKSTDDSKRIKISSPEKTQDLISRSKSDMVSVAIPNCSSSLHESTKFSKEKKKSNKENKLKHRINKEPTPEILRKRSNFTDQTQTIASPSKSKSSHVSKSKFKKPTYLVRIPIHSIPKHLQNYHQNPEDILAALLKNSAPINRKKDIDERAIRYNLLKQKLELARTGGYSTFSSELCQDCFVHLRRYNFANMWATQKKAQVNYKQDTTPFYLASSSIQDSDKNSYIADMNNNSEMSLEVGSTIGKGSKRKIKKITEENKMTPYPVNQYVYLDGPNDSSSDDEEAIKPTLKKKCRQPRKAFSQSLKYSPLNVNFGSPTKPNLQKQAIPCGEDAKKTSKNQPQPKYKRKLSFSKNISLNRTEIEEKLVCTYTPKEKTSLKNIPKDVTPVVQDKAPELNTENNSKLVTQNEFGATLITPYQKERTITQIQHKIASKTDENETNQKDISKKRNVCTTLFTLDYQDIVQSVTQALVPKKLFESLEHAFQNVPMETQKDLGTSLITPYQKQLLKSTEIDENLQTKLVEQNKDFQSEFGPSLLTPYQKQSRNSPNINFETENQPLNLKGESQNVLGTALITPYQKEYSKLSQDVPQFNLDDTQLSSSSPSLSDDIFSPNMPNSFSSEVFTSIEDKNQEIDHLEPRDPAELYDEKNKFVPQAGTSKFADRQKLTQISESSDEILTPKPISLNSNESENTISTESELKLSADSKKVSEKSSEIDRITPYQKENLNFEVGGLCKAKIESSGSDITPYQKGQNSHYSDLKLTSCLNIFEFANQNLPSENGCKIIVPKFQPPSRILIEATMQDYNIPMESHQEPFYSDVKDVTGPVEVGVRILKIPSDKMVDLPEFESSFKGINHYRKVFLEHMYPNEKITNRDINNYKMSFCKSTNCIITPAKLPPSREEVELWLKSKLEKKQKIPKVIGKKKIIIPCSPGADNDNSDDSLTISPCTPLDETLKNVQEITEDEREDETSKSSLETKSDNTSPIIKKSDALKRHRKRIFENSSLTNNQSSENTFNSQEFDVTKQRRKDSCQITGVTLDKTNNFAISCDNLQNAKAVSEYLHLTVFCMELIVETRNDYKPNPSHDTIKGIIYQIFNDVPEDDPRKRSVKGCFLLNNMHISPTKIKFSILDGVVINNDETVKIFESEIDLLTKFVEFLTDCDPDILVGYEIEMLSWGYLIERGYTLSLNLISLLSRVPQSTKSKTEDDLSDLTIPGRIILDFWRLLRHEIALQSYTFENIVYHILHRRVPLYSFKNITFWWNHVSGLYRNKVLRYYFFRVEAVLRIMDQLDLIGRTSELAKLFGIQFFEVLSRGSQFRVESMMLRLAKPLNYIPVSPSVQQRAKMRAPESLPLIMEPESKFYADPVIVLDFQSLYPSMIIAYNYCFSTCLGRIEHLGHNNPFEFGATQLKVPRKYIRRLSRKDLINISPCGVGFVKKTVREGILPRMLQEILDTRLMVKKSLKKNAGNKTLEKVLDARQLGLKLIANVTYGYTAANFSGRMPCIEVGDSVVSKGRETLQRAINLVEKTSKWEAKVVYGDTDSIFVLVHGKSRQEAFKIGAEIAEAVTNDNPSPVKLKLEKIFHPCILQTKKRYVGYMYESPEQEEPEYLAKGIETVRRDGCPAVSKMLEKCLKILFDTRDVSLVRQYVVRQFSKIISGRISIQDLTFAKEYRGASSYRPGACVPALELARKWLAVDKRNEPRRGERVPYVIINGPPGLPLIRLVRCPRELIADPALRPNALYYITKVIIPPINRCFLLIGADVNNWFNDMPRKQYQYLHTSSPVKGKKSTISQYFSTKNCVICGFQSKDGICEVCLSKPQDTSVILHEKVRVLEQNCLETKMICESCCCTSDKVTCISLDCPVYYKRIQTEKEVQQTPFIRELISLLPNLDF